ncbi:MAG: VWA domain-containing protein, partial [Elusimicrobiota bacterium]|nr:VWA domain-containing protein [Elusimicrobiota bacterium]
LFTGQTELYIPPRKGKNHILRIIRELIAYKPENRKTNIAHAINEVNKLLKRRSIIILISDFLDDNFQKSLKLAKLKHDIIPVVVSDKMEKTIEPVNVMVQMEDLENENSTFLADFSNPSFLKDYSNFNAMRRAETEKTFSKAGIDFIHISAGEEIYKPVMKFFKKREHIKVR